MRLLVRCERDEGVGWVLGVRKVWVSYEYYVGKMCVEGRVQYSVYFGGYIF